MKILLFFDYSGNLGDGIRISKIYEFLKREHDVLPLNLSSYHTPRYKLLFHPDVFVDSFKERVTEKHLFKIKAHIALGRKVLKKEIEAYRPDAIMSEGTNTSYMAVSVKGDIKLISDLHGLKSAELLESGKKISKDFLEYLEKMEDTVYRDSEYISVVSSYMQDYIAERFDTRDKIIVIPNASEAREKTAKFSKPLKVIYGGIFAFWEDVDSYLDLAKMNNKHDFYIMGGGPLEDHVRKRIKDENIRIHDLGYRDIEESLNIFSDMSVGVAPSSFGLTRKVASPIKVFDYMSCGLPVITPRVGEWSELIDKYDCGVVTENSKGEEFKKALEMLEDKSKWETKSKNALELIKKKYNWNNVLKPLSKILIQI